MLTTNAHVDVKIVLVDLSRGKPGRINFDALKAASSELLDRESTTTNSSPPWRLTVSDRRTPASKRSATDLSNLSPIACPSESLMCLKSSKSKKQHGERVA